MLKKMRLDIVEGVCIFRVIWEYNLIFIKFRYVYLFVVALFLGVYCRYVCIYIYKKIYRMKIELL